MVSLSHAFLDRIKPTHISSSPNGTFVNPCTKIINDFFLFLTFLLFDQQIQRTKPLFVFYTRKHHTFTVCSHTNDYRRLFYRDIEICPQKYTTVWDIVNKQKNEFFFYSNAGYKIANSKRNERHLAVLYNCTPSPPPSLHYMTK